MGAAFTNNVTAVLDVAGHDARSWWQLGRGGEDMLETAALLKRIGAALEEHTTASASALRRMEEALASLQQRWNS